MDNVESKLTPRQITLFKEICTRMDELHGYHPATPKDYQDALDKNFTMFSYTELLKRFITVTDDIDRAWSNFHYGVGDDDGVINESLYEMLFNKWERLMHKLDKSYLDLKKEFDKLDTVTKK